MPPRRSHKKSRNGCDQCKSRRVKCDEVDPCINCTKRGLSCTYGRRSTATASPNGTGVDTPNESSTPSAGPAAAPVPVQTNVALDLLQHNIAERAFSMREWSGSDIELMHHYSTVTYKTLTFTKEIRKVWKTVVPKIAYSYEFLMHGILSIAAAHLAYLKPEKQGHYVTASTFHMALGLQTFRRVIRCPTQDNCSALFSFSTIIIVWNCATSVESREKSPNGGAMELLHLCRGDLGGTARSLPTHTPYRMFPDVQEAARRLHELIDQEPLADTEAATCHHALTELEKAFREVDHAKRPREGGLVLGWPLGIQEGFIGLVEQQQPVALILLAYYGSLLRCFRHFWFFEKQADVLLSGVTAILPGQYALWLDWPMRQYATRVDPMGWELVPC
ncbi:hypothetical protein BDV24DRAFT_171562 [Aspergillus arachidicola]|uniref:Zn(2)-C6 fungal-type domain-containing protein n=1 Tax=Aspergillus arachidicola TaxID=656916 RepID=A0A5N6XRY6_9EURO|nr:hypothetical protein BDV24DRAFT_171562 [Aspergillus arachidicola]